MAKEVVHQRGLSIRVACTVFSISESCYRYEPKQDAENALIADWLIRLTLWPVLPVPAQRQRLWLEPQARVPYLPCVGIEPAYQAQEASSA